jgi:hypothetical protein
MKVGDVFSFIKEVAVLARKVTDAKDLDELL